MTETYLGDQLLATSYPTNLLTNGGFDYWQRGTTLALGSGGTYSSDRWAYPGVTGGAVTVSQETTNVHDGANSMKVNCTSVGSASNLYFFQFIENYLDYAGKTISFSVWIKTTLTNVCIAVQNGTVTSAFHPGDGNFHQLTLTTTLATNITFFNAFAMYIPSGLTTGITYVDSAMLVVGSSPVSFVAVHPAQDFARCQRYYEIGSNIRYGYGSYDGVSFMQAGRDFFKVTKRVVPTLTLTNTQIYEDGSSTDVSSSYTFLADAASVDALRTTAKKSAGGQRPYRWDYSWTADAD